MGVSGGGASARFSLHVRVRIAMKTALGGPEQPAQISGVPGTVDERRAYSFHTRTVMGHHARS